MPAQPNYNLFPPGGYAFDDPSGVHFEAGNWPGVIQKVRVYRERNGIEVGNLEQEIFQQFCSKHPTHCKKAAQLEAFQKLADTDQGFSASVQTWVADTFSAVNRGKIRFVSAEETTRRVKICQTCPLQRRLDGGCVSCGKNFAAIVGNILEGRAKPPGAKELLGCKELREDTRVSTHLNLPPVANSKLPAACWRKLNA